MRLPTDISRANASDRFPDFHDDFYIRKDAAPCRSRPRLFADRSVTLQSRYETDIRSNLNSQARHPLRVWFRTPGRSCNPAPSLCRNSGKSSFAVRPLQPAPPYGELPERAREQVPGRPAYKLAPEQQVRQAQEWGQAQQPESMERRTDCRISAYSGSDCRSSGR